MNLPGAGSKLLGGGRTLSANAAEARAALLAGFLPEVPVTAEPDRREAGFREVGLPYAADAAITRHLARFLSTHGTVAGAGEGEPARPDAVLFNGGFFASPVLRERLLGVVSGWFENLTPEVLANDRLDLAVSRGAAYFGLVRRGRGVRVEAGLARTYYLGVEDLSRTHASGLGSAVCVVPAGTKPGETVALPDTPVSVRVGRPVELPVFSSGVRLTDPAGSVHPVDEGQFASLPPIRTVLKSRGKDGDELPAVLEAGLSEIGTLDLAVRERGTDGSPTGRRWSLSFDVRSTTRTDLAAHVGTGEAAGVVDDAARAAVDGVLDGAFGPSPSLKPKAIPSALADAADLPIADWPPTLLRSLWEGLMDREPGRRESPAREARWLNLLGYALRPGYGVALDDWRVAETWRRLHGRLAHADAAVVSQSHVLWRRICGGLEAGQQRALAEPLAGAVKSVAKGKTADPELLRLLASLERLPAADREAFGRAFLKLAAGERSDGRRALLWWCVGRTGARVPLYGPADRVVPARVAEGWIDELRDQSRDADDRPVWPVVQLARKSGDRYLDLDREATLRAMQWLAERDAPARWVALVRDGGRLEGEDEGLAFGESLPAGLRLG